MPTGIDANPERGFEVARIEKTKINRRLYQDASERQKNQPMAVICCESAGLGFCIPAE